MPKLQQSLARKSTLRGNGEMMRTMLVEFALGRDDVASVILSQGGQEYWPKNLVALKADIFSYYRWCGKPCNKVFEEMLPSDDTVEAAYALADKFFPDLGKGRAPSD